MYRSLVSEFYSVQEFCKGSVYGAFLLLPENYKIKMLREDTLGRCSGSCIYGVNEQRQRTSVWAV